MEGDMGARQRLTLLACASGAVLILLGRTAHSAAEQLATVPPQSWGLSELSDAVVAGTCACGTLGALWHVVSALVALMALAGEKGPDPHGLGGTSTLAARVLATWGAPAVRRITASALLVSLSSAPALATQETGGGDDLGWRPTSSAPSSPSSQSSTPSPPEQSPSSASTGSGDSEDASQSADSTPPGSQTPQPPTGPDAPPSSSPTHTVTPGESLWSITAHLLPAGSSPARIAQAWPALYRANSEEIGADPSLIRPGAVLSVPDSLSAPGTTTGGQAPSR
ncbi:peptidoglycan-binding protein LysM [Actinomyces oris]|uniref:LysM peptidoglycan-binding domain-containing protein n=1 Tax=Actinomyces oris TaxID=544580 RepID=UPI000767ECB3|nr:LysM domain-containing protein [Actinomyces oris]AMD99351.1 peptidoglycan-binding protein LysM [Actinomyces oris]